MSLALVLALQGLSGDAAPPAAEEAEAPAAEQAEAPEAADPAACAPSGVFPGAEWERQDEAVARARPEALAALEAAAFPALSPAQEAAREGVRTEGLLVIQRGAILYERYARGYDADTPHLTWSVSKTWVNALAGLAVGDGALDLDASICEHYATVNPESCAIRARDLLSFASGIEWRETYENDPPTTSSVIAMLYGEGRGDMAAFVSAQPRRAPPGTVYQYSSGDTVLLSAVVQAALAPRHGRDFPWTLLFEPLGMGGVTWERDAAGTLVGSSYVWATPRDMARLGLLYLNDGCWAGERLLPPGWVAQSTTPQPAIRARALDRDPDDVQGMQIWLNQGLPELGDAGAPWPSAPADTYAARGHWKQAIAVIPSLDMVIVRVGDDRDGSFSYDALFALAAALGDPAEGAPHPRLSPDPEGAARVGRSEAMKFNEGLLGIGTAYGAKLACSCRYVSGRDADTCRAWAKASPDLVKLRFDDDEKVVTARAFGLVSTRARWVSERDGCALE